jgi:hypothetical protein
MSETLIFLTENDFINLADFVLKTYQATFIPAVNYDNPEGENLKSIQEIEKHLTEYPHEKAPALTYHITSPLWTIEPLYFDLVENKFIGSHYSVRQRYGGPCIDLIPRMYGLPNSSKNKIVSGMIGDYSYYISGSFVNDKINGYKTIARPESLKNALTDIKKFIKKNGHKVVYRNSISKVAFAMAEASQLYDKGIKLMQGDLIFKKE